MGSYERFVYVGIIIARVFIYIVHESKNAHAAVKYSPYIKRAAQKDRSL